MIYRFTDKSMARAYDIHPDGRKFGFYKNFKFKFAIVEDVNGITNIINPGDHDYDVTLMQADESGEITIMGIMTEEQLGLWCVAAFFEIFIWPHFSTMNTEAIAKGMSDHERSCVLNCCLKSFGVVDTTQFVTDFVNNNTKPSFRNLGLTDVPDSYKMMLES